MRRRLLVLLASLVVLAAVGVAWVSWPRSTTEITETEAVQGFRDGETKRESTAAPTSVALPPVGVYTYSAEGSEQLRLGPLPSDDRGLPATITAVISDVGDECVNWMVNRFAEHIETTRFCDDDGRLRLAEHVKHQRIGPLSPVATMTCDPSALDDPGVRQTELACQLALAGGPVAITAQLRGTSTTGAAEHLRIGGTDVEVRPVVIALDVTGNLSGSWTETLWLRDDRLPVKVERRLDLSGPASVSEHSMFQLTSLDPTR